MILVFFIMCLCVFFILDGICYTKAKYPERSGKWWSLCPGSGFYALWKFGKGGE